LLRLLQKPDGHLAFGYGGPQPFRVLAWPGASPRVSDAEVERIGSSMWLGATQLVSCDVGGPLQSALFPAPSGRFRVAVFDGRAELTCRVTGPDGGAAPLALPLHPAWAARSPEPPARAVSLARFDTGAGSVPVLAIRTFDSAAGA